MFNLSNFKKFVKTYEKDIVLIVGIILIALISFGAGRLTMPKIFQEPMVIEDAFRAATTTNQNLYQTDNSQQSQSGGEEQGNNKPLLTAGKFVASKNSKYYHWPWSPHAKNIKSENRIWFNSEEEAQKAGYQRSSNFLELAPVGYLP